MGEMPSQFVLRGPAVELLATDSMPSLILSSLIGLFLRGLLETLRETKLGKARGTPPPQKIGVPSENHTACFFNSVRRSGIARDEDQLQQEWCYTSAR